MTDPDKPTEAPVTPKPMRGCIDSLVYVDECGFFPDTSKDAIVDNTLSQHSVTNLRGLRDVNLLDKIDYVMAFTKDGRVVNGVDPQFKAQVTGLVGSYLRMGNDILPRQFSDYVIGNNEVTNAVITSTSVLTNQEMALKPWTGTVCVMDEVSNSDVPKLENHPAIFIDKTAGVFPTDKEMMGAGITITNPYISLGRDILPLQFSDSVTVNDEVTNALVSIPPTPIMLWLKIKQSK